MVVAGAADVVVQQRRAVRGLRRRRSVEPMLKDRCYGGVGQRADLDRGARAYKDVNRLALRRVAPGGFYLTFSCSAAVDTRLFRQVLFSASREARVRLQLLAPLAAAPDHPVDVTHPEGEYLKGWLGRVV